jgi:uncharacterized protein (TIGR03083 family)
VFELEGRGSFVAKAVQERTEQIVTALKSLSTEGLRAPSALSGWDRLTVLCHLRYGAEAIDRMTRDALAARPTSFYPQGRVLQRPLTLAPRGGEVPADVVASLALASERLHDSWACLSDTEWSVPVVEPADNPDLGPSTVAVLALLRLTEVEVHGGDLMMGLPDWSDVFVSSALVARLEWLNKRRSNHRPVDEAMSGSWLLVALDGPTYLVTVGASGVRSTPADATAPPAVATIQGSSRDVLALLLGRPTNQDLELAGDVELARAFSRAFPGP